MKTQATLFALSLAAASLIPAALQAQTMDPDPDIFDANKNGAGLNGAPMPQGNPNASLGGSVSVVNESALPPLGSIDFDVSTNPGGMRSGSRSGVSMSTSSSGMGMPRGGGSGGGQEGSNNPLNRPPPGGGQQSQSESQSQSKGRMPKGAQSQSQSESSESGEIPEGMKPSDQSGEGSPMKGKLPPPPPESQIGDPGLQIDPNGQLPQDGEAEENAEGEGQTSSQSKKRSSRQGESSDSEQSEGGDDQEMPEDMGNGKGAGKRGSATVDDVGVPSNI